MTSVAVNTAELLRARQKAERAFKRGCYPQSVHDAYIDETFKIKREAQHA